MLRFVILFNKNIFIILDYIRPIMLIECGLEKLKKLVLNS